MVWAWPFSIDFSDKLQMQYQKMHAGGEQETIILQVMALSCFNTVCWIPTCTCNNINTIHCTFL